MIKAHQLLLLFLLPLCTNLYAQVRGSHNNLQVKPIAGGFELQADIITANLSDRIDISLGFAVVGKNRDGTYSDAAAQSLPVFYARDSGHNRAIGEESKYGKTSITPLTRTKFRIRREFKYAEINKQIQKLFPGINVGPGDLLFLHATWPNTGIVHYTGLASRNGQFLTPAAAAETDNSVVGNLASIASRRTPKDLDYALEIDPDIVQQFNIGSEGLKLGGEIHTRLESEGKFQVAINELPYLIKRLFSLASDENPHGFSHISGLGTDWQLTFMDKYLVRDHSGLPVLTNGYPTVHPMVDTYYDHPDFIAAQADMAIRYRFTEHNGIGNWNIKPGGGVFHKKSDGTHTGIVDRLEYGIDVTNDDPSSIMSFADSNHNANPFRIVRQQMKKVLPSQYHDVPPSGLLQPSVRLTTYRYKFLLKNKVTGLEIEVSVDDVWARALRKGGKKAVRFAQVEMDIEHIAAVVGSTTKSSSTTQKVLPPKVGSYATLEATGKKIFINDDPRGRGTGYSAKGLLSADSYELVRVKARANDVDGLHAMTSLRPNSSVRRAVQSTLIPAAEAIEGLRSILMDLAPYNIAPAKLPLASALLYGHRRSQGVQAINYLIDDSNGNVFDFSVGPDPQPNNFSCRSFLESLGQGQ